MRVLYGFAEKKEADLIIREAEASGMETAGFVESGPSIYEHLLRDPVDLLVSDLCLAEYDLARVFELLTEAGGKIPPVIIVTSIKTSVILDEAVRLSKRSVSLCVYRPVEPSYLVSRMKMVLQAAGLSWDYSGSLNEQVARALSQIGVSMRNKGANYLRDTIVMCIEEPASIHNIKGMIAPVICDLYHIKYAAYRIGMQRCLQEMDVEGHRETLMKLFPEATNYMLHNLKIKDLITAIVNEHQRQSDTNVEERVLVIMDQFCLDSRYYGYSILKEVLEEALEAKTTLFDGTDEEFREMFAAFCEHPDTRAYDKKIRTTEFLKDFCEKKGMDYRYVYTAIDRLLKKGQACEDSWWDRMRVSSHLPVRVMIPIMLRL